MIVYEYFGTESTSPSPNGTFNGVVNDAAVKDRLASAAMMAACIPPSPAPRFPMGRYVMSVLEGRGFNRLRFTLARERVQDRARHQVRKHAAASPFAVSFKQALHCR